MNFVITLPMVTMFFGPHKVSSLKNIVSKDCGSSVTLAASAYGCCPSLISAACRGRVKLALGFKWRYV